MIRVVFITLISISFANAQSISSTNLDSLILRMRKSATSGHKDSIHLIGQHAIKICREIKDSVQLAQTFQNIGNSYFIASRFDSSYRYYHLSAEVFEKQRKFRDAAFVYRRMGTNYKSELLFTEALQAFHNSLELFYQLGDSLEMSYSYSSLASLNRSQGNYELSLEQAEIAHRIARSMKDDGLVGMSVLESGLTYATIGVYDSALTMGEVALKIFETGKYGFGKAESQQLIVKAHIGLGNYSEAEQIARKYLRAVESSGNIGSQSDGRLLLGKAMVLNGKYKEGLAELNSAIALAGTMNYMEKIMDAERLLSFCYERLEMPKEAFDHLSNYVVLRDSVFYTEKSREIEKLQAQFSLKNKQREIEQLRVASELKDLRLQQSRNRILLVMVMAVAVIAIVLLFYNRKILKQRIGFAEEREKLQKTRFQAVIDAGEKERKRIARELHDGIGQQLGGLRIKLQNIESNLTDSPVKNSFEQLKDIVNNTATDVRTISHQMMPRALTEVGLGPAMRDVLESSLGAGNITFQFDNLADGARYSEQVEISIYRILQELINNIIKHSRASKVSVQLFRLSDRLIMTVQDNGIGMKQNGSDGHGLLNIKQRSEILGGNVLFESGKEGGVVCTISIPVS